ncbi:hypothetical protein Tco_0853002 [Tanacetum coccineum]
MLASLVLQGLRGSGKLKHGALSLYVGNGMREAVEAIGSSDLVLPSGLIIVLDNDDAQPYENTSKIHDEVVPTEVDPQNVKILIRRSERMPQAPDRYGFYVDVEEYELGDLNEPPNYKAASSDPESDKWLEAMNTKMQSMKDNQVWVLVDLPPNGQTVRSK